MEDRTVRVGPIGNIESLLRSMDCDPRPIIKAAGLSPEDLKDMDQRLPYAKGAELIDHCAKASNCHHFGLLLGQRYLIVQLGIAGRLAYTAPDVATALHDLVSNFYLHDNGGTLTQYSSPRNTSFAYTIIDPHVSAAEQVYDMCVTCLCGTLRSLCGVDWNPAKVEISRVKPEDPTPYTDYFRAPVLFNAPTNKITFSNKWLDHPLLTADMGSHSRLERDALETLKTTPRNLSWEVRGIMHQRLFVGDTKAAAVARSLGLTERTLHRRLRLEGTNFSTLLEEVRQTAGCHYLRGTSLPIKDVAHSLGYRSTDAFDHAFKHWYGCSPLQWRQSHLAT